MHDKIQVLLECSDVVTLDMFQHAVHDVQVRDLVHLLILGRLNLYLTNTLMNSSIMTLAKSEAQSAW